MPEMPPGGQVPPAIEGVCGHTQVEMQFAIAALFCWIEEIDIQGSTEYVSLSLDVNWRDVSIAHAAAMKKPSEEILVAAPNRYSPSILLHDQGVVNWVPGYLISHK